METKEIYYEHNYKEEWETTILEIIPLEKGYGIILEKSAFYPGGGGQPCDLGRINNAQIIDIYKKGSRIFHVVDEMPQDQHKAICTIDQERRLDLMQQHSGQHLLSAVFYKYLKGQTSSFHLGLDYTTIDISIAHISEKDIRFVEDKANEYIYDHIPINHYPISQDQIEDLDLRKRPKVDEGITIVEIQGVDSVPCCGTHLRSTAQLGILKIIKAEHYKGNTRIYFKCGKRALEDYQYKDNILSALVSTLSTNEQELVERVEKELEKNKELSREMNDYKQRVARWEAKSHIKDSDNGKVIYFFEDKDFEEIHDISQEIVDQGDYIVLFASAKDKKILLEHTGQSDLHCGKIFKEHLSIYQGRGGGNNRKAQAAFATVDQLNDFFNLIEDRMYE